MTPQLQTWLALIIVAFTVTWLIRRSLVKRKKAGCGGDCGCPTNEFKAKLKS